KDYSDPGNYFGIEEFLGADEGKIQCSGKHCIEVEKSERRNQKVCLVYFAEMHRSCSCSSHDENSDQYHSEQKYNRQCGQVFLHKAATSKRVFAHSIQSPLISPVVDDLWHVSTVGKSRSS